jgi:1,2-diacylglycerol 3-alpha-glucosyltransferase
VRIAHFCDSHAGRPDGVSRSAGLTVALLRAAGHDVGFVHPGPLLTPRPEPGRVRSVPIPFRHVRVGLPGHRVTGPADLVHVHTTGPIGMTGFRLAERWRVPLVMTWHTDLLAYAGFFPEIPAGAAWCALRLRLGWSPGEFLELTRPGEVRHRRLVALGRAMFARMTAVIAPSAKTAAGFAEFGDDARGDRPEVCVLPTPVVASGPAAVGRSGGNVVLSVGRATAEKNPELLLRAFAKVRADKPDARLIMLGVLLGRARLRQRIDELGLTDAVEVLPPVPHAAVADYYRAADVLAFASTTDTQSLVLAEAEAAGLPVVLADPALARRPGAARCATEPEPGAFAAGLLRMLDDEDLRARAVRDGLAAAAALPPRGFFIKQLVL